MLARGLKEPNRSPFIGHLKLSDKIAEEALKDARKFLNGDGGRISSLFRNYPYFSAWLIANSLTEQYGKEGHAVSIVECFGTDVCGYDWRVQLISVCDLSGL
nr:hypothetical protein [uncultured Cohaesibacter sp.]